jgi:signal transduction histidine kinase/ActR/RegA family two-component response regulator
VDGRSLVRQRLRNVFHVLRLRGPLAADPTARILHTLVLALAIWFTLWSIVTLPLYPDRTGMLLRVRFVIVAELVPVATLVLLRLGYFRQAALFYLAGQWVHATYRIAISGSIQVTSTAYYITLPILATWLLGFREAFWTAGVCLGSALIFALSQGHNSVLPGASLSTPLLIWANLVPLILTGVAPIAHILRTLRETLAQSRSTQKELQQYKQLLERLVEQRTAELVVARDQALAASEAKSAFLATVSHELRSPLNTILLLSEPACIDAGASDACRQDLDLIQRSGTHLLHLINDILDSARIEAGQIVVENEPFDLRKFIREARDLMQVRAEEKSLDLHVEEMPGWPRFVQADRAKLRHILINLIDNAIKYTDRGTVTLRGDASPAESANRLWLSFEIADTGIGIASQDQARIFEPFTRLGNVAARKGTGLGLSITRQYVLALGGRISVESVLGEGSHFRVDVPVDLVADGGSDSAAIQKPRVACLAPGQPDCRVLIVDDRPEDRLVLRRILEDAGFLVQAAETGESGVEMFQAWRPHFIWMDRRLPLMDGLETTRRIRSLDGGRDVRIAGVSASAFPSEREEILAAGLDDFVRKPYVPNDIFDCMARHIGVRYAYVETAGTAGATDA